VVLPGHLLRASSTVAVCANADLRLGAERHRADDDPMGEAAELVDLAGSHPLEDAAEPDRPRPDDVAWTPIDSR
jgi:hypothetical protein